MLQFITDAPAFWLREIIAFARGVQVIEDGSDVLVRGTEESDIASVIRALSAGGWKVAAWRPRLAISDPTYQMAAAAIERDGGPSGAPAASRVR